MTQRAAHEDQAPSPEVIAIHVMREMTIAQEDGRRITALDLSEKLGVRRTDIRAVVSNLHHQGLVDAMRMRVTLAGFAYVRSVAPQPLRRAREARRLYRAA